MAARPTIDDCPELVPVALTATVLGLGEQTLRDQIDRGEFPVTPKKVGGCLKFSRRQLRRWLDGLPPVPDTEIPALPVEVTS